METSQSPNRSILKAIFFTLVAAMAASFIVGWTYSYSNSPRFCGSCHSMADSHASWQASNHKQFDCAECHLPNDGFTSKFIAKARTGIVDVYHETARDYPAAIQISAQGKTYVRDNCLRCHKSTVENTFMADGDDCTKCHRSLVHSIDQSKGGIKVE